MYHLSKQNLDGETLYPRVPESCFGGNWEEDKTKRVCISPSISGCYRAIQTFCDKYEDMYVHTVENLQELIDDGLIIKPTRSQVCDVIRTNEYWALGPVKLRCIGRIRIGYNSIRHDIDNDDLEYDRWLNNEYKDHVHYKYLEKYSHDDLYESIINAISRQVKKILNENI